MSLPSPPDSNQPEDSDVNLTKKEGKNASIQETYASKRESTGQYLEDLSRQMLDVNLNYKTFDHPIVAKHMSPEFRGKHDTLPKVGNRDDHVSALQKHLQEMPNFHCNILNSSSDVDDSRGRATVYLWYEITGLTHGLEREAVAVLSWERKQGTWMMMKHTGMRGPSGFA